jgi:arsenite methyltransferase
MSSDSSRDENEQVREAVRDGYGKIARRAETCCGPSCCGSGAAAQVARSVGYSAAELAVLPEGANMGLSCGNPAVLASLQAGDYVTSLEVSGRKK